MQRKATQDYLDSIANWNQPQSFNMTAPENIVQQPEVPIQSQAPVNPDIVNYLKQKQAPIEQAPITPPPVVDNYSDENRAKAVAESNRQQGGLALSEFGASMGQALAGKGNSEVSQQYDKMRSGIQDRTVGEFERGKLSQAEKEKVSNYLKQQQTENAFKEKSLAENIASRKELAQMQRDTQKGIAAEKAGKQKELSGEEKKRYDLTVSGYGAIQDMTAALKSGQSTFSLIGDNDFTEASRRFGEALGRLNSGGAISDSEQKRFLKMAPTVSDSKEMQQKKIAHLNAEFKSRLETLGRPAKDMSDNNQDQEAVNWAQSNPNDPRAKQILQMHGM